MVDSKRCLFPYKDIRKIQDSFMEQVVSALEQKRNLIMHAPTGLGKTIAVLGPALSCAIENDLTVIFLTSRHTQHLLAVETVRDIQKAYDINITVTDIIGKRWMCPQPGSTRLFANEFGEYCRKLREDEACEFYSNTRDSGKLSAEAKKMLSLLESGARHTEEVVGLASEARLCPYEITVHLAGQSHVIIADYYYIYHPVIREYFLKRSGKDLSKCIVVVDEAHNLPDRVRDLASSRLSTAMLQRAVSECRKHGFQETEEHLQAISVAMDSCAKELSPGTQRIVGKDEFTAAISKHTNIEQMQSDLEFIGEEILERQHASSVQGVANFLEAWQGPDEGYARIMTCSDKRKERNLLLKNHCLDPSLMMKPLNESVRSTLLMSGTLTPTQLYRDVLGFADPIEVVYPSPFPKENRLNLIIPKTTTRYAMRNDKQFQDIAHACAEVTNDVPGNSILFFPSYFIRDQVYKHMHGLSRKTAFLEKPALTKDEKTEMLESFRQYAASGAVLHAVVGGSFSEGIDLPGDLLRCVVIVGLPLQQPNLETKALIEYYDKLFGSGWDYGYVFPAFNKAMQSAGRCIRSETDRGVVVFLDERYLWPRYRRLFPEDWEFVVTKDPTHCLKRFYQ
jgi:DNA excision repair protein ERCC-2